MNRQLKYLPVALAAGTFLSISFVACVAWDAVFPEWAMRSAWAPFLPGYEWLSIGRFFLGLAESFAYGFWFASVIPAVQWMNRRLVTVPPVSPT